MDTLGDDLVLLAIGPDGGRVRHASLVKYGLAGSELVRLIAKGLVEIEGGRLVVTEPVDSTGDPGLDAALASIAEARVPPTPKSWVAHPRRGLVNGYVTKLAEAGRIQRTGGARARWWIADQDALATARARLDAIATSTGPVELTAAAYSGLAHAANLDRLLYRGWDNRELRKRMQQVAKGK
jgi:hypothetical protein